MKILKIPLLIIILLVLVPISFSCFDSDGGKNYSTFGIVSFYENNILMELEDRCVTDDFKENNILEEFYCDERNNSKSLFIQCDHLCHEGRCITQEEVEDLFICSDSDSGKNPTIKGITHGRVSVSSSMGVFYDSCLIGFNNKVIEYFCNEHNLVEVEIIECTSQCLDGACLDINNDLVCDNDYYSIFFRSSLYDDYKDISCCSSDNNCVYNKECYSEFSLIQINGSYNYCSNGFWLSCGNSEKSCIDICNFSWANIGESYFFGGFINEVIGCCGDNEGEYYIEGIDSSSACCDNSNDSVINGVCYKNQENNDLSKSITYNQEDKEHKEFLLKFSSNSSDYDYTFESDEDINNLNSDNNKGLLSRIFGFFIKLFN
jgi:hypothetical protein